MLESFVQAQQPGAMNNFQLTWGNKTKLVNLKIPLAFIIGDAQGGDTICGGPPTYSLNSRHISQMCNVTL